MQLVFIRPVAADDTVPPPERQVVVPSTPKHPRNGEADIIRLKNGDLLRGYGRWHKGVDDGRTWRKSNDVDIRAIEPKDAYGADEPAVIELKDGRVMMIIRTNQGYIARADSRDGGATWGKPAPIRGMVSPNSPASITPVEDRILLTYYGPEGLILNRIHYDWFYQKEKASH